METVKQFKIIESICVYEMKYAHILKNLYIENKIQLHSSKWGKQYKNDSIHYPLDLTDIDKWRTLEKCVNIQLYYSDDKLMADVDLFDGSGYDGSKLELRWKATFILTKDLLIKFADPIRWKFDRHLEKLYDLEQQYLKDKRLKEISDEILCENLFVD